MAIVTEPFEPVEDLGTEALRAYQQTGLTPAQLQARVAELEGALAACRVALDSCTPGDTSTGHVIYPYHDENAVNAAQDLLDGLGIASA